MDDLARIAERCRYVNLSVDVLAPKMMLAVAEGIKARGIDIRWGAEIRLERFWDKEKCQRLAEGGCVMLSVGFESASQRVVDDGRKESHAITMEG